MHIRDSTQNSTDFSTPFTNHLDSQNNCSVEQISQASLPIITNSSVMPIQARIEEANTNAGFLKDRFFLTFAPKGLNAHLAGVSIYEGILNVVRHQKKNNAIKDLYFQAILGFYNNLISENKFDEAHSFIEERVARNHLTNDQKLQLRCRMGITAASIACKEKNVLAMNQAKDYLFRNFWLYSEGCPTSPYCIGALSWLCELCLQLNDSENLETFANRHSHDSPDRDKYLGLAAAYRNENSKALEYFESFRQKANPESYLADYYHSFVWTALLETDVIKRAFYLHLGLRWYIYLNFSYMYPRIPCKKISTTTQKSEVFTRFIPFAGEFSKKLGTLTLSNIEQLNKVALETDEFFKSIDIKTLGEF